MQPLHHEMQQVNNKIFLIPYSLISVGKTRQVPWRIMLRRNGVLIISMCFYAFAHQDSGNVEVPPPDSTSGISSSVPQGLRNNPAVNDSMPPIEAMPQVIHFVKALYPDSLIEKGIEGTVEFDLLVSDKGTVDSAAIVRGLHPVLDSSALAAIRKFTFAPATSQGKPVSVLLRYAYRFSLESAMAPVNEAVNFFGTVREKGTRASVAGAVVAASFEDTVPPKKHAGKFTCVDKKPDGIPLSIYLESIGKIKGQKLEEGLLITKTDSLGRFSFCSLPSGTIQIKIVAAGCRPIVAKICIRKGKATRQEFWLERDSYNGYEIIVYGKANETESQHYGVSSQELKRVPGFNGEAVKLLQALPGVSRPVVGGNEMIVRGTDNSDTKFYLDGIEIPYLYHPMSWDFMMYRGILNTDALQSVSLYPSGWGVGYGNALGGIVDLQTRPAQKDRWHGSLDANLKGLNLLFETPLWKNAGMIGSYRINALFDEIGFLKRRLRGEQDIYVQDYWDYSLRFDWQIAPSHHIAITAIGANDTMYQFNSMWEQARKHDPSQESSSFGQNLTMGIAAWHWTISPNLENILRYGIRPTSYKSFFNNADFGYYADSKSIRQEAHDELKYKVGDGLIVTGGLDLRFEPFKALGKFYSQDTVYTHSITRMFGPVAGYLSCEWKPTEKLTISPGLRYDYYTQLDYHGSWLPEFWDYSDRIISNHTRFSGDPSLRVSGRYELNSKHAITASAGNYNESPDSVLMTTGVGNELVSEKGSQYTLGYEWKLNDLISLNWQGYVGTQWDKFRWKTSEELVDNSSAYFASNGKARMEGLELMLRHDNDSHFFGWLGYSLSYSERYNYGEQKWVEYDYNALNNVQLVADWFFKGNQCFGLHFQYTDGYPYTPHEVQLYDATNFIYIAKAGATNSERHTPYLGLDLRYEKKFIFKRSMLTAYIEGERLFHLLQYVKDKNGNPFYHPGEINQYNYDYSGFESIPIFPMGTLGLTWEF
jgi:TonB family protein